MEPTPAHPVSVFIDDSYLYENAVRVMARSQGLKVKSDRRVIVFMEALVQRIVGPTRTIMKATVYGPADPVKRGVYRRLVKEGFTISTTRRNLVTGEQIERFEHMIADMRAMAASTDVSQSIIVISGDKRIGAGLLDVLTSSQSSHNIEIRGFDGTIAKELFFLEGTHSSRMHVSTIDDAMIGECTAINTQYNWIRGGRQRRDLTFVLTFSQTIATHQSDDGDADALHFAASYSKMTRGKAVLKIRTFADEFEAREDRAVVRETATGPIGAALKLPVRSEWSYTDSTQLHVVVSGCTDGVALTGLMGGNIHVFSSRIRQLFIEEYADLDVSLATLCQVKAGPLPVDAGLQELLAEVSHSRDELLVSDKSSVDASSSQHDDDVSDHSSESAKTYAAGHPAADEVIVSKMSTVCTDGGDDGWTTPVTKAMSLHVPRTTELCASGFRCVAGFKCQYTHSKRHIEYFQVHGKGFRSYKQSPCVKANCEYLGRLHLCPYAHKGEKAGSPKMAAAAV